jgi:PAS domain S-box-containing protein
MKQLEAGQSKAEQCIGTIFIVDDEMMVTTSLQTMLGLETEHRIHCFNSPLDALAQLEAIKPDVVISDFSMPGMDGISFLREVKNRQPESTLILLTGYADKESAIEAINTVGLYRYIEKPWDNEELKISISNGLERNRLVSNLRRSVEELTAARAELEKTNQQLEALVEARTQDLHAAYQKLHSIINNTADGILTLDEQFRITSINPAATRWFETAHSKKVALGAPIEHYLTLPPTSRKSIRSLFTQAQSRRVEEVFIGELPFEAGIAPLNTEGSTGDASTDNGFVVVLRDITERKEIERLRDDFVSTLTHDLRTPLLAAIQTMGFFVDGSLGELAPRQKELLQMLIQSNREMLGLVNVLLEVYKYESGRQKLILDKVNLHELLVHVCQELHALAQSRGQTLQGPELGEGFTVLGDKQELKRVFVNLVGNAINFTPKEGCICVTLEKQGTFLQVCVQDNGRGIPAQDIPLLFQRFSQGTSKQRSSGSGLGLYLSRQIVEAHQGSIWVESEEGKGSRFYVSLPAQL